MHAKTPDVVGFAIAYSPERELPLEVAYGFHDEKVS
jgi:hypothetical protein